MPQQSRKSPGNHSSLQIDKKSCASVISSATRNQMPAAYGRTSFTKRNYNRRCESMGRPRDEPTRGTSGPRLAIPANVGAFPIRSSGYMTMPPEIMDPLREAIETAHRPGNAEHRGHVRFVIGTTVTVTVPPVDGYAARS